MKTYDNTKQRITEIIGEASMLWSETPTGTFNSEKASELVEEIMGHIEYFPDPIIPNNEKN